MIALLNDLYDYGMLDKNGNEFKTKEWIFIPYEDEFKKVRDSNFKRAFDQFCKSETNSQFRTTVTCPLLLSHKNIIESKVLALTNEIIDLSEKEGEPDKNSVPFTIGVFSSIRKFGHE